MRLRPTNRTLLFIGLGLFVLVLALSAFYAKHVDRQAQLSRYADQVIATCGSAPYPPSCYDKEIPKLMDQGITMEEGFAITHLVQARVKGYYYCHVLGHELAAKETAKDPSKWTDVLARCPAGECANGCLHGAIQTRFRTDVLPPDEVAKLIPDLAKVCEPGNGRTFTGLEQPICYHALGHVGVYLTDASTTAALAVCDAISATALQNGSKNLDSAKRCYEGAFMEYFQFLEPEDIALVKNLAPKTQTAAEAFCSGFPGEKGAACHRESWPLYWDSLQTSAGIERFCAAMPGPDYEQDCYNVVINIVTAKFDYDIPRIVPVCEGLPAPRMGQCFAHAASRFVDTDYSLAPGAVQLCAIAAQKGVGDRCYTELLFYASFDYQPGSHELQSFCTQLPAPWDKKCVSGEGKYVNRFGIDG